MATKQTPRMKWLRKILKYSLYLLLSGSLILAACYYGIEHTSRRYLYSDTQSIPANRVGIILGTSKYLADRRLNLFYKYRIRAAIELWQAGKVQYFIVSGANPNQYYNEPAEMRRDLIAAGIPESHIQPDYAGLRTLDSILRAEKIFQQRRYTIISQPFHNARAVFLARQSGHDVIAYNAADPISFRNSSKTRIREIGARFKAVLDIFILRKQAKIYGDPIPFPKDPSP